LAVRLNDRAGIQTRNDDIDAIAARPRRRHNRFASIADRYPHRFCCRIRAFSGSNEVVTPDGRAEAADGVDEWTRHQMECIGWNVVMSSTGASRERDMIGRGQ